MRRLDPWKMALERTSMIEASAGTGKTFTLCTLYLRLLVEHDLRPAQLLVVTFTQAATAELRDRVRKRIREAIEIGERPPRDDDDEATRETRALVRQAEARAAAEGGPDALRRALRDFDEAAIFTIHGFCQRTLQENAFESGLSFDTELVEDSAAHERAVAHDLYRRLLEPESPAFVAWLVSGPGRRWGFTPEKLQDDLLARLGADDTMPIVPDPPDDEGPAAIETAAADADAARVAWLDLWRAHGDALREGFLERARWDGRKLGPSNLTKSWLPALDAFAEELATRPDANARIALALPDCFFRFGTEALEAASKDTLTASEREAGRCFEAVLRTTGSLEGTNDRRALWLRHRFVEEARAAARARRDGRHRLFFDDLLGELRRALRSDRGEDLAALLRDRYRFALIDEFQDTDPVQYEIFRRVWHERPPGSTAGGLVLIGDPKQAIYSFRDADVFTYLAARTDAEDRVHALDTNWRTDPPLIDAVNGLFGAGPRPFLVDEIRFEPVESRPPSDDGFDPGDAPDVGLRVFFVDRETAGEAAGESFDEAKPMPARAGRPGLYRAMANALVELLEGGARIGDEPLRPSDVAVLCRRKSELAFAREALEAVGVPCVDRGDADVFDEREAWELHCVMQAWLRPGDPAALRAALATSAEGGTASRIAALADDDPALAAASERYAEYGRLWSRVGFARAFESWRRGQGVTARLLRLVDGDRRLTNWLHLAELLQARVDERVRSRAGLVALLERAIASPDGRAEFGREASLLRLERDDHAVELVTLHRSKGLEFPIVLMPGIWDTPGRLPIEIRTARDPSKGHPPIRFHDPASDRRIVDLAGHDGHPVNVARARIEGLSEQLRLLYVGLTRAKHQCWIGWGAFRPTAATPLAQLLESVLVGRAGADAAEGDAPRDDAAAWDSGDPIAIDAALGRAAKARAGWSDAEWRAAWDALAKAAGEGAVGVESVRPATRVRDRPTGRGAPTLAPPAPPRALGPPRRTTSFTALVREGEPGVEAPSAPEWLGRDVDAGVDAARAVAGVPAIAAASDTAADESPIPADLASFPRGTEAGTLLHDVLEHADLRAWAAGDGDARAAVERDAAERLGRSGIGVEWREAVLRVVDAVATTPLHADGVAAPPRLGDLAPSALRAELEFTLATPAAPAGAGLTPTTLADALARAPEGSPAERYAERARRLDFRALDGFLRGFIDLVFRHDERFYVLDYKSNHLGERLAAYRPDALRTPIVEHDYVLQYLLYTVALDRHLATRLPGYDYERHLGGVYYLFLRGMAPSHPPGSGVFFDRPPRALVETLAGWIGVPDRDGALAGTGGAA